MAAAACGLLAAVTWAQAPAFDAALLESIDAFVERGRLASGIRGIALAMVQVGSPAHRRGFGDDGRGRAISADTPFPIGSLTKSLTALLVRPAVDAGQIDADAPLQRVLPWFRVADAAASARITVRHLLNQTRGFSRADGIAALLQGITASIEELARGLGALSLNRPVGERFEYSNLNFVLLGAVLQAVTGRSWQELVQTQVLRPLQLNHAHTDHDAARQAGMTALHRMWFGLPVAQHETRLPGLATTGSLVACTGDMAACLQMLLAGGMGPVGRVVSADAVAQLLAPASPPAASPPAASPPAVSQLRLANFSFRYGEGWFVGPFGAPTDARWHLGSLPSFAAWMVLLSIALAAVVALPATGSSAPILFAFAHDLAGVLALALALLCMPAAWRAAAWARRVISGAAPPPP